jgi:hypothetical protein
MGRDETDHEQPDEQQMVDEQPDEQLVDDSEMVAQFQQELLNLTVGDHLVYMMQSLSALAVRRLGLADTAAEGRDLDQARLAIDAFKALVDVAAPVRPPEETAYHRSTLSQLQVAYVGALRPSGAPAAGTEESKQSDEQPGLGKDGEESTDDAG